MPLAGIFHFNYRSVGTEVSGETDSGEGITEHRSSHPEQSNVLQQQVISAGLELTIY